VSRLETFTSLRHTATNIGVFDFVEGYSRRVDVNHHKQFSSVLGNVSKVNPDTLVITTASTSGIVSSM